MFVGCGYGALYEMIPIPTKEKPTIMSIYVFIKWNTSAIWAEQKEIFTKDKRWWVRHREIDKCSISKQWTDKNKNWGSKMRDTNSKYNDKDNRCKK